MNILSTQTLFEGARGTILKPFTYPPTQPSSLPLEHKAPTNLLQPARSWPPAKVDPGLPSHLHLLQQSFSRCPVVCLFSMCPVVCLFSMCPVVCLFSMCPVVCLFSMCPVVCLFFQVVSISERRVEGYSCPYKEHDQATSIVLPQLRCY